MQGVKILTLDIETKPAIAYIWRMFDENIGVEQILENGGLLCFGAKWVGEKGMMFYSEWEHGQKGMVEAAYRLFEEADAIVTYNGDKFDIPKLRGEMALQYIKAPPPVTSIDMYKVVKKLGYEMNKLAFIGPHLQIGSKVKHEGFSLWSKVLAGDERARKRMRRYCLQDVRVTERLYNRLKGYILNHPHMGGIKSEACGACGSHKLQNRGFRRTKSFRIQRRQCQSCGSWQDGTRQKVT
jgi:DNA polymerase elongation subunit (family B)